MNLKKFIYLFISLFFLNSCMDATALLGPAVTVGTTGNVYQAGFTYSSNYVIMETTGKTAVDHFVEFMDSKKFKDGKKRITSPIKKLEESIEKLEKRSMDFYYSAKNLYLIEKK